MYKKPFYDIHHEQIDRYENSFGNGSFFSYVDYFPL